VACTAEGGKKEERSERSSQLAVVAGPTGLCSYTTIAHLADHVPCGWMTTTFLIARFIHSRLVLWDKHHQARLFSERKSRMHSNGPIQRTKTHSPSCT
jgi:hypothetical protein